MVSNCRHLRRIDKSPVDNTGDSLLVEYPMSKSVEYPNWRFKLIFACVYLVERKKENEAQNRNRAEKCKDQKYLESVRSYLRKRYHTVIKNNPDLMGKRRSAGRVVMKKRWATDPEYRKKNIEWVKRYHKTKAGRAKRSAYLKRRRDSNPAIKLMDAHRGRIRDAIRERNRAKWGKCEELTGCTREQFMDHIESQFEPGMSWDNYGYGSDKWNLDHIRPLASFDLSTLESQKEAFSYKNSRPMWQPENIRKASVYNGVRYRYSKPVTL